MNDWDKPEPPPLSEAPKYLRALADVEDGRDDLRGYEGPRIVQRDLRYWADEIEKLPPTSSERQAEHEARLIVKVGGSFGG